MTADQFVIEARLITEREFLCECILLLYNLQDDDEQGAQMTTHVNGRGFNKSDAPFLSICAEKITQQQDLSAEEERKAASMMKKYAIQLSKLIDPDKL